MEPLHPQGPESLTPAQRLGLALVLLAGLLVQLPTLAVGFFADDYVHQLVLDDTGGASPIPRWSLYDFGSAEDWAEFGGEHGALPWWTAGDWRIRFFRPLASLSLGLDHALWGDRALGYHFTSLALWLGLLVLVHRLYRTLGLAPSVATLGLLVFALSDAGSVPVGWIANRNSLLEALCAAAAVTAALRGRAAGALALGVAAALCKESGVFVLLLVAAVLHRRGRERPALAGLLLACATLALLAACGFGTRSLFYATPWSEPVRFASNLLVLLSAGTLSFLGPFPLDLVSLVPAARLVLVVLGIVVGWPLAARIVRSAPSAARGLLGLWTVLLLVPQGGVAPADRLLFVPSIGAAGLLALAWSAERARWPGLPHLGRIGISALALSVTLGSGGYLVWQNAYLLPGMAQHVRARALATDVGAQGTGRREVLVLQTENQMQGFTLGATWRAEGGDPDVRFWVLQSGTRALRWTRTGERAFELETLGRPFLIGQFEGVYLTRDGPPAVGTRWRTPLFEVEAAAVDAGGLRRIRVTLERSLDDPALRFVRPVDGVLTALAAPAIGASIELPEALATAPFVP